MFGFLRSRKLRIGVEMTAGEQIGAVLGPDGPLEVVRGKSGLKDLLSQLPVRGSQLVIAPPRTYHISTIRKLDKVCLESLRLRAEVFLPYDVSEASFIWRELSVEDAAVAILPTEELKALGREVQPFAPASLYFEPVEFTHARMGTAVYVADSETSQLTLADQCEFLTYRIKPQDALWATILSRWKGTRPEFILGGSPEVAEATGLPSRPLAAEATARELAASPAGKHRLHCV